MTDDGGRQPWLQSDSLGSREGTTIDWHNGRQWVSFSWARREQRIEERTEKKIGKLKLERGNHNS